MRGQDRGEEENDKDEEKGRFLFHTRYCQASAAGLTLLFLSEKLGLGSRPPFAPGQVLPPHMGRCRPAAPGARGRGRKPQGDLWRPGSLKDTCKYRLRKSENGFLVLMLFFFSSQPHPHGSGAADRPRGPIETPSGAPSLHPSQPRPAYREAGR